MQSRPTHQELYERFEDAVQAKRKLVQIDLLNEEIKSEQLRDQIIQKGGRP